MTASGIDLSSSDAGRSAKVLRHAQYLSNSEPLKLESGSEIKTPRICFETYGELAPRRDNAVLICHAISGDSHVARHDEADDPGWWELVVGPGRPIDTDRYFVICSNVLGGCRGTTGPNEIDQDREHPYGADFPVVTVGDMVTLQSRLIDHLGIAMLHAVVGGSLGGLQALDWARRYPKRLQRCIPIAAASRLSSQAIAFDIVGRNAIRHDVEYHNGQYYGRQGPESGLALARMLAHITYLSDESMQRKFDPTRLQPRRDSTGFENIFSVGSYLAHQGNKFVERFDANSYIVLSTAMDLFDLGATVEDLRRSLKPAICRWLFLSFTSDWLYPPRPHANSLMH